MHPFGTQPVLYPSTFLEMPQWSFLQPAFAGTQRGRSVSTNALVSSTKTDIILGRGTLHTKHPGNVRFYKTVDGFLPRYNAAKTKAEKTDIIHEIYEKVLADGQRFIKHDSSCGTGTLVDEENAKKKIGHTMRYRQKLERTKSSSTNTTTSSGTISRASSIQSLVTEMEEIPIAYEKGAPFAKPLPPPPKLAMFVGAEKNSPRRDLFSDNDLDDVLGFPGEIDLSATLATATEPYSWDEESEPDYHILFSPSSEEAPHKKAFLSADSHPSVF